MKVSAELWSADRCGNRKFASKINSQRFTNVRTQKDLKLYLIPNNHHLVKLVCAQNQSHASVTSSLHHQHRVSECLLFIYTFTHMKLIEHWSPGDRKSHPSLIPTHLIRRTGLEQPPQQWWVKWPLLPLWRSCGFVSKELNCTNHSRS